MGTLFTFLTVRIALVLIALTGVSMTLMTAIARNQPAFDPFAPYADILPGQSWENVLQRGFDCHLNLIPLWEEICLLTPQTGIFSEIQVSHTDKTGRASKVVFIPRKQSLVLGDLVRVWGKPQTAVYGRTVNFRWPNMHIVTVLQNYNGHFSYWLPISYVAFESAN